MIMYKIIFLSQKNNLILGKVPNILLCPVHIEPSYIRKKYLKKLLSENLKEGVHLE